jgi:hypothetical protein
LDTLYGQEKRVNNNINSMNLESLLKTINEVDDNLIIFQKGKVRLDSEIALFDGEGVEEGILLKDGIQYHYLIEVFLAKEFIEDLASSFDTPPLGKEMAERLFEYAVNDA